MLRDPSISTYTSFLFSITHTFDVPGQENYSVHSPPKSHNSRLVVDTPLYMQNNHMHFSHLNLTITVNQTLNFNHAIMKKSECVLANVGLPNFVVQAARLNPYRVVVCLFVSSFDSRLG